MWGIALSLFLVAHALVGVLMFAGRPQEAPASWPKGNSWILGLSGISEDRQRVIATFLIAAAALLLIGGVLGIVGVHAIASMWPWLIVIGAAVSALTLISYFSPWWLGGIAINAGLVDALLVFKWPTNEILGI